MATIDYTKVKAEDLEMSREPRKSTITVTHKPTGAVAADPVVPGSLSPARFRRPANMPKENRVKGMEGYIEGRDEDSKNLYVILTKKEGAEEDKNEYLEALAADAAALKASFEGVEKTAKTPDSESAPAVEEAPVDAPDEVTDDAPEEVIDDAPEEMPADDADSADVESELDDLLAEIDS